MQSGLDSFIYALGFYNGSLIASGAFYHSGATELNHVASWDGSAWHPLGAGLTGAWGWNMVVYGGKLIVGGFFSQAGGAPANNIAAWDGTSWSTLGSGLDGDVASLAVFNGNLIAVGSFTHAGGVPAQNVAQWNGSFWSALGSGTNSDTYAATVYNGQLVVAGRFTEAGGVQASNIAAWNGSAWNPLGSGITGYGYLGSFVYALSVYNGNLYAGGLFTRAGGQDAPNIARWDGTSWSPLGSGVQQPDNFATVYWLSADPTTLYAGGYFFTAGATSAACIARWSDTLPAGVAAGARPVGAASLLRVFPVSPNPSAVGTSIRFVLGRTGLVRAAVYDFNGRQVRALPEGVQTPGLHEIAWDGLDDRGVPLASGVYFARLETGGETRSTRILIVR